jgi:two-component system sensor histidine kinase AlgZ
MNKARSIKQNTLPDALPNFRNLGVTLRILLVSIGLALLQSILLANTWTEVPPRMMQISTLLTPVLLASLLLLWAAQPWLDRLAYWQGALAVNLMVVALTLAIYRLGGELYYAADGGYHFDEVRYALLGALVCSALLTYFRWRSRVLSRALHEARLQALQARIRPHFLFNTLNAVLSIVRAQPGQAEAALEDMADLFRMAMADVQDLVPLQREIQLAMQYMALEQLRMGDRLHVEWQVQDAPGDALIPPLLLQPLLENAVYHGIEPLPQGGCIKVLARQSGDELQISVENPYPVRADEVPHAGSRMALQNIRERLELLFDVEARYQVDSGKDYYRVEITLPYEKGKNA